jgi:hypothetical protein
MWPLQAAAEEVDEVKVSDVSKDDQVETGDEKVSHVITAVCFS